jgi:hypothetical protein
MSDLQDLSQENFDRALATAERPDLLRQLVELSRSAFGVHTRHYPHTINYPWAASRLEALPSTSRLLEIGAGVNPLPLFLAGKGMFVDCVDGSDFTRTLPPGDDWNEWGYFDYSTLHPHLASYNVSATEFETSNQYDAIYCISVIALMPTPVREATLRLCRTWLRPGGRLVLAIDLIAGTDTLWNRGGSEEAPEQHGTWRDVESQLLTLGFRVIESKIERNIPRSPVDLHFLVALLDSSTSARPHQLEPGPFQ